MALIGLYSGREIKTLAKKKQRLTRSQTAAQAKKAIEKKYKGGVVDSALYYHNGGGNWVRHSKKRDAQRTGKVTDDIKEWRKRPHKLDYVGVDTKGSCPSKKSPIDAEYNKYFIQKRGEIPLIKQFRKNYSTTSRVGYVPFSSGLIVYHDEIPVGAIVMQDRKTGLYFMMFIYPDGTKTAKISRSYDLSTKYSKKDVIGELGTWEKRTGNIT